MLKDQNFYAGFPGVCRTPLSAIFRSSELTLTLLDLNSPILQWRDGKRPVWDWLHPEVGQQAFYRVRAQLSEAPSRCPDKEGHRWTVEGNQHRGPLCAMVVPFFPGSSCISTCLCVKSLPAQPYSRLCYLCSALWLQWVKLCLREIYGHLLSRACWPPCLNF